MCVQGNRGAEEYLDIRPKILPQPGAIWLTVLAPAFEPLYYHPRHLGRYENPMKVDEGMVVES
jgi:hypothetical protein